MTQKSIMVLFVALVLIVPISCTKQKVVAERPAPIEIRVPESLPADKAEIVRLRAALADAESKASLLSALTSANEKLAEELSAKEKALKAKTAEFRALQQNFQVAKALSIRGTGEMFARMKTLEGEQNVLQQRFNIKASELIAAAGEKARLEFQLGERTKDLDAEKKFSAWLQSDLMQKAGKVAFLLSYLELFVGILAFCLIMFGFAIYSKRVAATASRASS